MTSQSFTTKQLLGSLLAKGISGIVFIALLFFLPRWSLDYWQAWAFLGVLVGCMTATSLYLLRNDRALLERRLRTKEKAGKQKAIILLAVFLICLPIVFLACAIQTLIASFTKTTKEAGTYLPFIGLIPSLPGLALAFLPVKPHLWTMLIPTFGQQILINQFLRAEPILGMNIFISAVLTILLSVVVTFIAIKLYEGERIIMG